MRKDPNILDEGLQRLTVTFALGDLVLNTLQVCVHFRKTFVDSGESGLYSTLPLRYHGFEILLVDISKVASIEPSQTYRHRKVNAELDGNLY